MIYSSCFEYIFQNRKKFLQIFQITFRVLYQQQQQQQLKKIEEEKNKFSLAT